MKLELNKYGLAALILLASVFLLGAGNPPVVKLGGKAITLKGTPPGVGEHLPSVSLPDNALQMFDLGKLSGKVTIVSVVPSIDTRTCEKQTHILSEENGGLDQTARLMTISRDLPFAQKRFAEEAKIHNILFLSDYRDAEFGNSSGLLMEENRLLARAVFVLDKKGVIRHMELVKELGQLPDMKKAFEVARSLS